MNLKIMNKLIIKLLILLTNKIFRQIQMKNNIKLINQNKVQKLTNLKLKNKMKKQKIIKQILIIIIKKKHNKYTKLIKHKKIFKLV